MEGNIKLIRLLLWLGALLSQFPRFDSNMKVSGTMLSLTSLPTEVTTLLASVMDSQALFNFRLTSKQLHLKSKDHFIPRYFGTRCHMLSRRSLATLLAISLDPVLRLSVHTLEISIKHLIDDIPCYQPGTWDCPGDWQTGRENGIKAVVDEGEYIHHLKDQKMIADCGLDTAYLTSILTNLTNCKNVSINDTHEPWGSQSQKKQVGISPSSSMWHASSVAYVKRTIQVVLTAITSSRISLDHLGISTGFNRKVPGPELLPSRQQIYLYEPVPQHTHITYLFLTINPETSAGPDTWIQDFLQFMQLFKSLRQFGLYFYPHDDYERLHSIGTNLELECLEFLSIAGADCSEDDLATLFLKHKYTLSEIHLDMVNIIEGEGSWASLENTVAKELNIEQFIHNDHE